MADNKQKTSFSELALALADDYESIFVINASDDSYVEYSSAGADKELVIRSSGDNFYDDTVYNCRLMVWPEDQNLFLRTFRKEKVLDALKNGKSFALRYRLIIDNEPCYYFLKTIKSSGNEIIIGVQNVDEQTRREKSELEKNSIYGEIAKSLGSMFEVIYYIDTETGHYTEYYTSKSFSDLGIENNGENFFEKLQQDIEKHIYQDDREMLIRELDKTNLIARLNKSNKYSIIYRQILDGRMQYVSLFAFKQYFESEHLVIAVRNIDSQIRHEELMNKESELFSEIAMALALRYEVIYRVDLNTDEYMEYSAGESKYSRLQAGVKGENFFIETQKNMKKEIHPDDYPIMSAAMRKTNLLNNLKESGKLFLRYRLKIGGEIRYTALFAVRPQEDSDHLIVAVANIDYSQKKTEAFEEALGGAMNMDNRDPLTGLKNKRFYAHMEMKYDSDINEKRDISFAMIACDINDLRKINETLGYKAGDEYILEAGKMLTNIFQGCDIYRVGGDEFVVILENEAYDNRKNILYNLADIQSFHRESGEVTVAYGMAEYDPKNDIRLQDVYERAFKAMRRNKNSVKGINEDIYSVSAQKYLELTNDNSTLKFYELFVKLVSVMTDINTNLESKIPLIEGVLIEISTMFRLSKGITRVYRNPEEELNGGGETLCCFDTGLEGDEIITLRVVTSVMSIVTLTVYMSPDEIPLSEEERWRVELIMRTTISYISRNRLKDIVYELAYYDDYGYLNQRSFMSHVAKNLDNMNGMIAVRYNLLHFRLVNQDLGRIIGDKVMRNHYEGICKLVGENGIVCRLGGDDFISVFDYRLMGNVFTYLNEAPIVYDTREGKTVNISASVGVFKIPKDMQIKDAGIILERVNLAYQTAKNGGQERIVFFDASMIYSRDSSMKIQRMFPDALKNEEFQVYYQPKVHIDTGRLVGAEALCRWFHNDKMISPGDFIPMLEETDDICALDFYMLDHVCRDIRRWIDRGMKVVRVSVNLSRKHMINRNLVDNILKIIDRHNVPHSCIEIELTETTTDVEFNDMKRVVSGLQSVGILTSVDDFGIGYSSLNLIRELSWNVLKVDRSFLPTEEDGPDSVNSIMFRHVISMVNELGIECIVEGVETEKQLELLRSNNCFYAQGFFFDRPLPVRNFEQRLAKGGYSREERAE